MMVGLPDGLRIRVSGLVSPRAASSAAVAVDLLGNKLPAASVEILDAKDVVAKTFAPSDGVGGGDSYFINGAP